MKRLIVVSAGIIAFSGGGRTAWAAQTFSEFIPASACQVEFEEDIGKVELIDGSWVMDSGLDDSVSLICPIRISHFFVTNVVTGLIWDGIQLFYRDPDGMTGNHEVKVELIRTITSGTFQDVLFTMSSNSNPSNVTTNTLMEDAMSLMPDALVNAQHYGRVTMTQDGGTARVTFTRLALLVVPPL